MSDKPIEWFPSASTWVSVGGAEPLMVEEVHYDRGCVKLNDGSWAAFSRCVQVPEPTNSLWMMVKRLRDAEVAVIEAAIAWSIDGANGGLLHSEERVSELFAAAEHYKNIKAEWDLRYP